MRTIRLLALLMFACLLSCFLSASAFAQESIPNLQKDPTKTSVSTGLNNAINLSAALLAIDDKSPMASSLYSGLDRANQINAYVHSNDYFKLEFGALTTALAKSQLTLSTTTDPLQILLHLKNLADDNKRKEALDSPTLFNLDTMEGQAFRKSGVLQPDTQAVLNQNPVNRGVFILNRLLLRDYIVYIGLPASLQNSTAFTAQEEEGIENLFPPDLVASGYYAGIQVRTGGGPTVYTPEVIYSSGLGGFDVAAQAYLSDLNGYAASFRFDLSPQRPALVHSLSVFQSLLSAGKQSPSVLAAAIVENSPTNAFIASQSEANRRVAQIQSQTRSSVQFSYRHIDTVGAFTTAGLSVSKLFPIDPRKPYNGITFLVGVQALQYTPTTGSGAATIRSGVAVYWQNRVSRLLPGPLGKPKGDIRRWTTQSGVEYNFRNSLQLNDTYGVFLRQRLGNFTELTVSVGRAANKQGFVGMSFGKTFF